MRGAFPCPNSGPFRRALGKDRALNGCNATDPFPLMRPNQHG